MSFLDSLPPDGPARDAFLLAAIGAGSIDPPTWVRVTCGPVVLEVSADYLSILSERVPMAAPIAQAAVDSLDALLPTPAIVDAIEDSPDARVMWLPTWSPGPGETRAKQVTGEVFAWCEARTREMLAAYRFAPGTLLGGHRKDVVIAAKMPAGHVAIYGARWLEGPRVQPLTTAHDLAFEDYSHGIRAVRRRCWLDGEETTVEAALAAGLLGGPVAATRYPTSNVPAAPGPRILRRGMQGEDVRELQRLLTEAGWYVRADGIFGLITETATKAFQEENGLERDGLAGPRTMAALRKTSSPDQKDPFPFDLSAAPLPLGDSERVRLFGGFEWEPAPTPQEPGAIRILGGWARENIVTIEIPQLRGVPGAGARGAVTCHRLAAPTFRRFFEAVEAAGKLHLLLTWGGCWNPRMVRGGTSLSNHAFGVDFDINAAWNMRGTRGAPKGERGSVVELVPIAVAAGLGWGAGWATPDPMHFGALRPEPS